MDITVSRKNRENRKQGVVSFDISGSDVGKNYDFMGIIAGFRILDVNVTVDEAFSNSDNSIEVGIEDDTQRFVPTTTIDSIKGVAFNNRQFTAVRPISLIASIKGSASADGKATVTVMYSKQFDTRQDY